MHLRILILLAVSGAASYEALNADTVPAYYSDEPACRVKSVRKAPTTYENAAESPVSDLVAVTQPDPKGVYQVYTTHRGAASLTCISCAAAAGDRRLQGNKPMISWHPSGKWLIVGVEETTHDYMMMPASWKRGLLQSGIWLNMWITTPAGDRWVQITDFNKLVLLTQQKHMMGEHT